MYKNRFIGSLIGGAVGDALGYVVEFDSEKSMKKIFGEAGITEYVLSSNNEALISDDTQMTLFTANGLIAGLTQMIIKKDFDYKNNLIPYLSKTYLDWYTTQMNFCPTGTPRVAWITNVAKLYDMRAPGSTCLQSCYKGANGTISNPINDRCGCGGVMRVAPIGLMFNPNGKYTIEDIDLLGASAAALTHGNPLGYIPAATLVHIINRITYTNMILSDAVEDSIVAVNKIFPASPELKKFTNLMNKALCLADETLSDVSCIHLLGDGWTGDEALAIAVFCAVRYSNNFEKAIIAAVNHSGDSDSTGAITGNILGAYLGIDIIPKKFTKNLELKDLIIDIATDLYACKTMSAFEMQYNDVWRRKYIDKTYSI